MDKKEKLIEDLQRLLIESCECSDNWKREAYVAIFTLVALKKEYDELLEWVKTAAPMLDSSPLEGALEIADRGFSLINQIEKSDKARQKKQ